MTFDYECFLVISDADAAAVHWWLQMFDDTNEITQTLSSSVAAPYVTIDSDDLDKELDSLLGDQTSIK